MERVQPGGEFALQGIVDGTMFCNAGQSLKRARADTHRVMCLTAGCGAGMTMVKMGLVHYIQLIRRKGSNECSPHTLCAACQFLRH